MEKPEEPIEQKPRTISILGREFAMPRSRIARVIIGSLLVLFGLLGFLPVLGFWMVPLGLLVLSYEFATVRRWRRRFDLWWAQRRGRRSGLAARRARRD
ncbi:PGPGW domain-containing protein [Mesorhizobium sp. CAU 1741]|uniref:PGPGW domain-containing protein n=1 Tax=Mesorhizobium sp. CAU 1741 TaxID=3140366 RepID=UPI00325ACB17